MQTEIGQIGIGTKETATKLQPQKVKIETYRIEMQKTKEGIDVGEKVVFTCKHPAKEETIEISSVSFKKGKEIKTTGTWFKLDDEGKIVKGSATASLIIGLKANNLDETKGKDAETELDDKGYLVFKAY